MSAAWVTRAYYDPADLNGRGRPKLKHEKVKDLTMKGVQGGDSFIVVWYDPAGRQCREKIAGCGRPAKRLALDRCEQLNSQLALGLYEAKDLKSWEQFREALKAKVLDGKAASSRRVMEDALGHFEKLMNPKQMKSIDAEAIDDYIAKRSKERGLKPGSTVSKATVNKELRHLKAALRKAERWGYLKKLPEFTFLKEDEKPIRFVTSEHFDAIYAACKVAMLPQGQPPADWWKALLITLWMTGWRIDEVIRLRWSDVDLNAGRAILRAEATKGKRSENLPLHPIVIEHLQKIRSFRAEVFGWSEARKELWCEFHRIQEAAGIKLECRSQGQHECTESCGYYGFHDLRRAFATNNAENMTADALQKLMRHKSYTTTQRYINVASQLNRSVEKLHVPTLSATASA